jgi:hypothetical protein
MRASLLFPLIFAGLFACHGASMPPGADPFADRVVAFEPGYGAGFGQDRMPDVVLGGPRGGGELMGGLDVVSLGRHGVIELAFDDWIVRDGPGPDFIVFENPFPGWVEPGIVEVSDDGEEWHRFPCDLEDEDGGYPGCAGIEPVLANVDANDIDPTDPAVAGGDAFDLADLGLDRVRYVRIIDGGVGPDWSYEGGGGGFDLDALAVVNGVAPN